MVRTVSLPNGTSMPCLGLGTWRMGESPRERAAEIDAVTAALGHGYRLIDTAEMYGEGVAEEIVGAALATALQPGGLRRDDLCIVSKVYPHHAGRRAAIDACHRSLDRLRLNRIDVYLLHWRGGVPLSETVEAFESLRDQGLIGAWGVSNFDVDDLQELEWVAGDAAVATNQVWYSLGERGAEHSLLPKQRAARIPLMAYSPIDQAALARDDRVARLAEPLGLTAAQLALAWVLRHPDVVAIPKARSTAHQQQNLAAAEVVLESHTLAALDALFPPPRRRTPLAMN